MNIPRNYIYWVFHSINLIWGFIIGYLTATAFSITSIFILIGFIILSLGLILFLERSFSKPNTLEIKKRLAIWVFFGLNYLFSLVVGFSIPLMESINREFFALFMLPLLVILNYIIQERQESYLTKEDDIRMETHENLDKKEKKKPIIEYEDKRYVFSINSLIVLAIGTPVLAYLIYFFFDWDLNYWLHEIVVKQTTFCLNLLLNMGASVSYNPAGIHHWLFNIPGKSPIYFETFCTGVQAICVFAGIILFTPHSQDLRTNRDIIWRKTKALIVSSVIFYLVNILRMLIQLYLYYIGYAWNDIHYSISAASSFIAAIIVLLMHKWIPEFVISLIYTYTLIKEKYIALRTN